MHIYNTVVNYGSTTHPVPLRVARWITSSPQRHFTDHNSLQFRSTFTTVLANWGRFLDRTSISPFPAVLRNKQSSFPRIHTPLIRSTTKLVFVFTTSTILSLHQPQECISFSLLLLPCSRQRSATPSTVVTRASHAANYSPPNLADARLSFQKELCLPSHWHPGRHPALYVRAKIASKNLISAVQCPFKQKQNTYPLVKNTFSKLTEESLIGRLSSRP